MSVYMVCERAIGLLRGNRLILTVSQKNMLERLDYEGLADSIAQDEAVSCARHFAAVRDRLLMSHPWVCARKEAVLPELDTAVDHWPYSYALPNDCLKVLSVVMDNGNSPVTVEQWEQFGNTISCRYHLAYLRYTRRLTNTDEWSPLFESAFCFSLAAEMAAGITGEPALYQNMEQGAQLRIQEAVRVGEIKKPLSIATERYGFHKFSDIQDPRYGDAEW